MDRIISLLAALVGLIALGGAILVHVNGDLQRRELAAEISDLKSSMHAVLPAAASSPAETVPLVSAQVSESSIVASAPANGQEERVAVAAALEPASDPAAEIAHLEARVAELEAQNTRQASELADAQARLADSPSALVASPSSSPNVTSQSSASLPSASASSAAMAPASSSAGASASTPVAASDCIPSATRFVGKPGESFAICNTNVVVKIAAIADGMATIEGAGPIQAGSFADLVGKGCSVMVFSADSSGFADLRVTCK